MQINWRGTYLFQLRRKKDESRSWIFVNPTTLIKKQPNISRRYWWGKQLAGVHFVSFSRNPVPMSSKKNEFGLSTLSTIQVEGILLIEKRSIVVALSDLLTTTMH
jgi:hypothetical protein